MPQTLPEPSQKKAYAQPTLQKREQLNAVTEGMFPGSTVAGGGGGGGGN
jgi:hypothetical protein